MKYATLLLLFLGSLLFSQELKKWNFDISFQLKVDEHDYTIQNYQVFLDDKTYPFNQSSELLADMDSLKFQLKLAYACETCSNSSDLPPDMFLKVNYIDKKTNKELSTIIPFFYEGAGPRILPPLDIGILNLNHFLDDSIFQDGGIYHSYVAVQIYFYRRINFLTKYEYQWKPMRKLTEIPITVKTKYLSTTQ